MMAFNLDTSVWAERCSERFLLLPPVQHQGFAWIMLLNKNDGILGVRTFHTKVQWLIGARRVDFTNVYKLEARAAVPSSL